MEPYCLPPLVQQRATAAAAATRRPSTGAGSPLSSSACPGRAAQTARRVLPTLSHCVPVSGEPRGRVHIQPGAATDDISLYTASSVRIFCSFHAHVAAKFMFAYQTRVREKRLTHPPCIPLKTHTLTRARAVVTADCCGWVGGCVCVRAREWVDAMHAQNVPNTPVK